MKKLLLLFVLAVVYSLIQSGVIYSQTVYPVKYESQADLKVYIVDYESQADLTIYKVDTSHRVDGIISPKHIF
jgi:hypothetical protein